MERIKKLIRYSDKIVIANDSPLKYLHKIDQLYILSQLFNQVYITETVRKKCKFEMPPWMIIKEPLQEIKYLLSETKINDKCERSAVGLVIQLETLQMYNIVKTNQCLILVDKKVKNAKVTKEYSIDCINLRDIFSLAYYKNIFTKDEGIKMLKKISRAFTNNDLNYIFGKRVAKELNNYQGAKL